MTTAEDDAGTDDTGDESAETADDADSEPTDETTPENDGDADLETDEPATGEPAAEPAAESEPTAGADADAGTATTETTATGTDSAATDAGTTTETTADASDGRYTRKKCVLITGCSSGIGRATALAFLQANWQVVATARNTDDITDLEEAGCTTLALDVTDPEQVARAVEETVEIGGAIDCLVNNAATPRWGRSRTCPRRISTASST